MNTDLKENLQGHATFEYYRDQALWYRTSAGLLFPVPVSDIGTATFLRTEKATVMMRWIRKYLALLTEPAE